MTAQELRSAEERQRLHAAETEHYLENKANNMNKQYQIEESRLLERLNHLEHHARNERADYYVTESLMQRWL